MWVYQQSYHIAGAALIDNLFTNSDIPTMVIIRAIMNYPAAEQLVIYKGIVTPQAAGN